MSLLTVIKLARALQIVSDASLKKLVKKQCSTTRKALTYFCVSSLCTKEDVDSMYEQLSQIAAQDVSQIAAQEQPQDLPLQLDTIPTTLIGRTASFLKKGDYWKLACTNRTMFGACHSPVTLPRLDIRHFSPRHQIDLNEYPRLTHLRLRPDQNVDGGQHLKYLKHLEIDFKSLNVDREKICLQEFMQNRKFEISNITTFCIRYVLGCVADTLSTLLCQMPKLSRLRLTNCDIAFSELQCKSFCPLVTSLCLGVDWSNFGTTAGVTHVMPLLRATAHQLERLSWRNMIHGTSELQIDWENQILPLGKLRHVYLIGYDDIDWIFLLFLAHNAANMESLCIYPEIDDDLTLLPFLQKFFMKTKSCVQVHFTPNHCDFWKYCRQALEIAIQCDIEKVSQFQLHFHTEDSDREMALFQPLFLAALDFLHKKATSYAVYIDKALNVQEVRDRESHLGCAIEIDHSSLLVTHNHPNILDTDDIFCPDFWTKWD